jgi:plasmid stabilization system protein ParE
MLIRFHPEARSDYDAAVKWYEQHSPRTAHKFVEAVQDAIECIAKDPHRFERVPVGGQRSAVKGFPYSINFEHAADEICIFAIAHGKRQPDYWVNRFTSR